MSNKGILKTKSRFYFEMGVIGVFAIVALMAAINEKSMISSFADLRVILAQWSLLFGSESPNAVLTALGVSLAALVVSMIILFLDSLGDMTIPMFSSWFGHFRKPRTRWSFAEHDGDWHQSKYDYREHHEIYGDRERWEAEKIKLGKASVRYFRTGFYIALMLLIAGVIDIISSSSFRVRGISFSVVGLVLAPLSIALWSARHEQYVLNLMSGMPEHLRPESYNKAAQ